MLHHKIQSYLKINLLIESHVEGTEEIRHYIITFQAAVQVRTP